MKSCAYECYIAAVSWASQAGTYPAFIEGIPGNCGVGELVTRHSGTDCPDIKHQRCSDFLRQLGSDGHAPIDARDVCVVVAHPDDEAVGVGGQLPRLNGVNVVHVTDGSPENLSFARKRGFSTREAYAMARERELSDALSLCRIPKTNQVRLGLCDQEAALHLNTMVQRLVHHFRTRQVSIVLTHPYEGGHPDHDATAFAVHFACQSLVENGEHAPVIIEMASYFAGPEGPVHQRFAQHPASGEVVSILSADQLVLKTRILATHATQSENMKLFNCGDERFRYAPEYDFAALPNHGVLHYEGFESGMAGERWLCLTAEAMEQFRLSAAA